MSQGYTIVYKGVLIISDILLYDYTFLNIHQRLKKLNCLSSSSLSRSVIILYILFFFTLISKYLDLILLNVWENNSLSTNSRLLINNLNNTSTTIFNNLNSLSSGSTLSITNLNNKTNFTNLLVSNASTINSSLNVLGNTLLNNIKELKSNLIIK